MPAFTQPIARWFRDHHGVAATNDLRSLGLSEKHRRMLLSAGVLEEMFEGVYHLVSTPPRLRGTLRRSLCGGPIVGHLVL